MMSFEWLDIPLAIEWLGESYIEGAVAISICSIYTYIYTYIPYEICTFPIKYIYNKKRQGTMIRVSQAHAQDVTRLAQQFSSVQCLDFEGPQQLGAQ